MPDDLQSQSDAPAARAAWSASELAGNAVSGAVASLLTIAYCLSFSALLFQGELAPGLAPGLWALLAGSAIAGLYVSLTTTIPPAEAGPDNPAVAVLSVLAGTVSAAVAQHGGTPDGAVVHVLLSFSLATLATGLVLYAIGALRLGQWVRFVPYPVIAGFLAASGWFLLTGGLEVVTGRDFSLLAIPDAVPREAFPQAVLALLFAIAVFAVRQRTGSMYALPIAFLGGSAVLDVLARWAPDAGLSGWYLQGSSRLEPWVPLKVAFATGIDWSVFAAALPEILAAAGVTVIALLLDVTGLEVARTRSADLDWEFRSNGAANILAAPLGGVMGNLSMNGSRLLDETGGLARMSGVFASLAVALVVVTGLDLTALVPKPVLAGLLMYLGLVVLVEVMLRSPARKAWTDFALALLIMAAIVIEGYLAGVVFGFIAACLMFAVSYSRIRVIRRHLTRESFASNVDRASPSAHRLAEHGGRIHLFWLSGYIFFGSANRMLEEICAAIGDGPRGQRTFAIFDLQEVPGFDTSAMLSLVKLKNYAGERSVTLCFAAPDPGMKAALERAGLAGPESTHRIFASRNEALAWCEEELLAAIEADTRADEPDSLQAWLAAELGNAAEASLIVPYFERRRIGPGAILYRQGAASGSIDFIEQGTMAVSVEGEPGKAHLVRRVSKRTVLGEMGFFRGLPRAATVAAEQGGAVIHTLSRDRYEALLKEEPAVAAVFLQLIIRTLADRLEFANRGIAALS